MIHNASTMLAAEPQSADAYRALVARVCEKKRRPLREESIALLPYVNHGRWVADCVCHGGIAIHPEWAFAGCLTCGRTYTQIQMPINWQAIERALERRAIETTQNWLRHETVEHLDLETEMFLEAS